MNLQESIALVYDPLKTAQGMLAFRAFRITQRYLDQIKYDPETQECPDPALEEIRRNKIMSKVEQIRVNSKLSAPVGQSVRHLPVKEITTVRILISAL